MLVRVDDDGPLAIGQLSHSWLSGQLARAWGNERFSVPEPRDEVVLGAQQHDIGWALFDLEPRLNADTGLPRNFIELSVEEHLAIWRDAPDRLMTQSLHAALVVSLHGASLSELRAKGAPDDAGLLQAHIDDERARQAELCGTLGVSATQLQRTRRQMWTWDGLSLALCNGWRPFTARDVPTTDGLVDLELLDGEEGTATLDPWPFAAERIDVHCEGRRLAPRYDDEAALRNAFSRAQPITLGFTLVKR